MRNIENITANVFKATKKCVNAELVSKVQNSKSNSILYGQKQSLNMFREKGIQEI